MVSCASPARTTTDLATSLPSTCSAEATPCAVYASGWSMTLKGAQFISMYSFKRTEMSINHLNLVVVTANAGSFRHAVILDTEACDPTHGLGGPTRSRKVSMASFPPGR